MNKIDQILTNFTAWHNAVDMLGTVDVELPSFEPLSETIKGAGIAGEATAAVNGHFGVLPLKLNWRTITPISVKLNKPGVQALDFRGNQQILDPANGYVDQAVAVKTRCVPLNYNPGKFAVASATETANEFEVHYIKIVVGNETLLEYDKFNYVYIVGGVDVMAASRKNLGLS